jgi:hypothetical protein
MLVPELDGVIVPPVYVPPLKITVSPAAALALAVPREHGVLILVQFTHDAEPVGET